MEDEQVEETEILGTNEFPHTRPLPMGAKVRNFVQFYYLDSHLHKNAQKLQLGMLKLISTLGCETRPFNPSTFKAPSDARHESAIRWRVVKDDHGRETVRAFFHIFHNRLSAYHVYTLALV
jgi:hypothetical protein